MLDEIEDMDIGELDLEGIEKSFSKKDKGYVPQEQVSLLKEAILKAKTSNSLGVRLGCFKETKRITEECGRKPGHKSNKQRVADVGRRLVESSQYLTIKAAFGLLKIALMKLLSWNTRGINSLRNMKIMRKKIKMTNPSIVFL